MKIAAVSEDGLTISRHFGRATSYLVATVEEGRIVHREQRPKAAHRHGGGHSVTISPDGPHGHQGGASDHGHAGHGTGGHGFGAAEHAHHLDILEPVRDCQVLLAGGMGAGAYESIKQAGMTPIVTDQLDFEGAVNSYAAGSLEDHPDRLH